MIDINVQWCRIALNQFAFLDLPRGTDLQIVFSNFCVEVGGV